MVQVESESVADSGRASKEGAWSESKPSTILGEVGAFPADPKEPLMQLKS